MAFFDFIRAPSGPLDGRRMNELALRIKAALNHLDKGNFPKGIDGDDILNDASTSPGKLKVGEWHYPLILLAVATTTTSTAGADIGGAFRWDPTVWPTGTWKVEAVMSVANASATATLAFDGDDVIDTSSTTATRLRSDALTMPTSASDMSLTLRTSSASYAASLLAARLIYTP